MATTATIEVEGALQYATKYAAPCSPRSTPRRRNHRRLAGNLDAIGFGWGFLVLLALSALVFFGGLRYRLQRERVEEHIAGTEAEAAAEDKELGTAGAR